MPAVTLVVGDEELLVARAVQRAVQAAVGTEDPDAAVHDVIAAELSPDELAELCSPSLFGGSRVVVIRAAQDSSKELIAAVVALAEDHDEDLGLVVQHSGVVKGKALLE